MLLVTVVHFLAVANRGSLTDVSAAAIEGESRIASIEVGRGSVIWLSNLEFKHWHGEETHPIGQFLRGMAWGRECSSFEFWLWIRYGSLYHVDVF